MTARRVVVTGLGVICALGHNLAEVWCALRAGRSGIGPIRSLDVSNLRFQNGAEVREYDRSEEHTSELQSRPHLVCRLLLEKKKHLSLVANSSFNSINREGNSLNVVNCCSGKRGGWS